MELVEKLIVCPPIAYILPPSSAAAGLSLAYGSGGPNTHWPLPAAIGAVTPSLYEPLTVKVAGGPPTPANALDGVTLNENSVRNGASTDASASIVNVQCAALPHAAA